MLAVRRRLDERAADRRHRLGHRADIDLRAAAGPLSLQHRHRRYVAVVTPWPGHVAPVEEIARDPEGKPERIRASGCNCQCGQGWTDRSCEVAKMFGIEMSRW